MRTASMTPVGPKWSREGSADGDEEWGPSQCVRRSQRQSNPIPIDSGSEGILEPTVKEEIKTEVTSPRVERPSSPSGSDEDPLSDRALQSLVKEEKLRCRSPSPSEDFIGFTEVDRDRTSKPVPRGSELLVYYGDDSARELTVHSETSGQSVTSSPAGTSSSDVSENIVWTDT
ncbi:hypothetical protein FJT64_003444 [Amphibalanus amphitrite]|uniref:Uncharacterized protein n=1 Tax=Amphibalanus amphitrite TaxID=1232801 RepID=A0A6A4W2T3_AMPAM|nr:hypothetical protein FJT64_003444 [Amphibalanus amphitrite]